MSEHSSTIADSSWQNVIPASLKQFTSNNIPTEISFSMPYKNKKPLSFFFYTVATFENRSISCSHFHRLTWNSIIPNCGEHKSINRLLTFLPLLDSPNLEEWNINSRRPAPSDSNSWTSILWSILYKRTMKVAFRTHSWKKSVIQPLDCFTRRKK